MELLPCGHIARKGNGRLCRHLFHEDADSDERVWLLTGVGVDRDVACAACDASDQPLELVEACEGCVDRAQDDYGVVAVRGEAGIAIRDEPIATRLDRTRLPFAPLDLAAAHDRPATWLLLAPDRVLRWNADTGEVDSEVAFPPWDETIEPWANRVPRLRLHAHAAGRFAAVVRDYGQYGVLLDLDRGEHTLRLDRQTYHPETTPFPVAFVTTGTRTVLVHATDWNRLDLTDAATGELLSERTTDWPQDRSRPEHYHDYFHGALHVSADGRYVGDDGWVWHPVGIPAVWDLDRWIRNNRWESDDGPSLQDLCQRMYYWDQPMCWTDDGRLVVTGIGGDDEAMIPGVRVFDPLTAHETGRFPGPTGQLFSAGGDLYAASPGGLTRWDLATGERTGRVPDFVPTHHHRASRVLVEARDDELLSWALPG